MNYHVGQQLRFTWSQAWKGEEIVTVTELRKRGAALTSNGWVVDADGCADGTGRMPGGTVTQIELPEG